MNSKTIQKVNCIIEARKTLRQQELKQTSLQTFARFFLVPWSVFGPSSGGTPEGGSGDKYGNLLWLLRTVLKRGTLSE